MFENSQTIKSIEIQQNINVKFCDFFCFNSLNISNALRFSVSSTCQSDLSVSSAQSSASSSLFMFDSSNWGISGILDVSRGSISSEGVGFLRLNVIASRISDLLQPDVITFLSFGEVYSLKKPVSQLTWRGFILLMRNFTSMSSTIDVPLTNPLRTWSTSKLIFHEFFGPLIGSQIKRLAVVCHVAWYIFWKNVILLQNLEQRISFLTSKNIPNQ